MTAVEWIAITFHGEGIDPVVGPAITRLVAAGTVRILDVLVVRRSAGGAVRVTGHEHVDLLDGPARAVLDALDPLDGAEPPALDVRAIAASVAPGSTALVVVWETRWAAALAEAVRSAGGRLLTRDRVPAC